MNTPKFKVGNKVYYTTPWGEPTHGIIIAIEKNDDTFRLIEIDEKHCVLVSVPTFRINNSMISWTADELYLEEPQE